MILDSSAIVALALQESGAEHILEKLDASELNAIGAPTLLETSIVLQARLGDAGREFLDNFIDGFRVEVHPFTRQHWATARDAFLRFGKGRHPAGLNYGDCMSYAVAKLAGRRLLFVGEDFRRTDIEAA